MEPHVIRVSANNYPSYYVNQGRSTLKSKDIIEFHGIGSSMTVALNAANRLCELNYATLHKIRTDVLDDQERKAYKLIVAVKKSDEFDKRNEEFESTRNSR